MMYTYSLDGYLAARGIWGAMCQEIWVLQQETCGLCTGPTGDGVRLPSEQVENRPKMRPGTNPEFIVGKLT